MKHKLVVILLLVILTVTSTGSAFAQGTTPPDPSNFSRSSEENSFWLPNPNGRPQVMKTNEGPAPVPQTDLPPTTRDGQATGTSPIGNGNFELGRFMNWDEYSSQGYAVVSSDVPDGVTPLSGAWIAWLGDDNNEHTILSQTPIHLPPLPTFACGTGAPPGMTATMITAM